METALQPFACNKMETRLLYSGRLRAAFQKYDLYMTTKNRDFCLYEWGSVQLLNEWVDDEILCDKKKQRPP